MTLNIINLGNLALYQGFNITGAPGGNEIGFSVSGAGDVNGDGCDDIIISAPNAYNYAGISYVIYGNLTLKSLNLSALTKEQGFSIYGAPIQSQSGYSVSGAGDVNNDTYADVIIGIPYYTTYYSDDSQDSNAGRVYIIYGKKSNVDINITNLNSSQGFYVYVTGGSGNGVTTVGTSVSTAGDVNDDGYDDIIFSTQCVGDVIISYIYVIYGGPNLQNIEFVYNAVLPTQQGVVFSERNAGCVNPLVTAAGDVNGDGFDDVMFEGPNQAYIIYGSSSLSSVSIYYEYPLPIPGVTIVCPDSASYNCGASISGIGDVNNDGLDDVIINGNPAAVVYGGKDLSDFIYLSSLNQNQGFYINGYDTEDGVVYASVVNKAGNVNGDDYNDVVVAYNYGENHYVIFGNKTEYQRNVSLANLTTSQGFSIYGIAGGYSSTYISGAGDINQDGYGDVVIGSGSTNEGTGITYIIYGSASGFVIEAPTIAPTISTIPSPSPLYIPTSVPSLSVMSINLNNLLINQGFEILGNNNGIICFNFGGSYSGWSVSDAGDVNGDGYDDVLIGIPYANSCTGISYVVYGNITLENFNLSVLSVEQGFSIYGAPTNSQSGYSVSGAGDVNNDTYADIIIGAPFNTQNPEYGYVYIIYGGHISKNIDLSSINFSPKQGIVISGAPYLGGTVSGAGDFNNDGFDDILIGYSDGGGCNYKYSYLIYGSNSLNNLNVGYGPTSQSGVVYFTSPYYVNSVSGAGDINGDGYDDVVLSAYCPENTGVAYIVYGGQYILSTTTLPSLTAAQGFSVIGYTNSGLGYSVSCAGDVNKDGFDDIIIGTFGPTSYIIFGGNSLTDISIINLNITQGFYTYSTSSSGGTLPWTGGAGDVNKDGYDDVIIGFGDSGYIIFGNKTLTNVDLVSLNYTQGFYITGIMNSYSGLLGSSWVSRAGDINNDGYDDIIIGAPYENNYAGASYVIYGAASGFVTSSPTIAPTLYISPSIIPTRTSTTVPTELPTTTSTMDSTIIPTILPSLLPTINPTIASTTEPTMMPISEPTELPTALLATPTFTPTHLPTKYPTISPVVIHSPTQTLTASPTTSNKDNTMTNNINLEALGFFVNTTYSGWSVGRAGDMNADGYADVIIGVPKADNNAGVSYVIYGSNTLMNIALSSNTSLDSYQGFTIYGAPANSASGSSVSGAGDVNGDGYDDVIIGAPYANNGIGISYVIFGGVSLPSIINVALLGAQGLSILGNSTNPNDHFGYSVSGAGDMNGDGYDDVIIGAPNAASNAGKTYVIYGGASLPSTINIIDLGTQGFSITGIIGSVSGSSVSGAGDVNNDGYDDIIIAAQEANYKTVKSTGSCYVVFGGSNLSNLELSNLQINQGFTIYGTIYYEQSGNAVSGAGDINNDGYDDVIIGANFANNIAGISYVVYGKSTAETININLDSLSTNQGFAIYGVASNDDSGYSVSGAGDVNNDGYDDVIIGAPDATPNPQLVNAGISYVIYGGYSLMDIDLTSLSASQGFSITGASGNVLSGDSVSGAGDVNNDGYDDIIIGTFYGGTSYIILGQATVATSINLDSFLQSFAIIAPTQFTSVTTGYLIAEYYRSGTMVSSAGDINGDGYGDVIVATPWAHIKTYSGYKYVSISSIIFGTSKLNTIDLTNPAIPFKGFNITMQSSYTEPYDSTSELYYSVSGAGDVNNDGYDDIIIGYPFYSNNAGIVYVIFGSASPVSIQLPTISTHGFSISGIAESYSGWSVGGAGDVNNDGYDDIIIGAPNLYSESGSSYVIFGGENEKFTSGINLASLGANGFSITGANYYDKSGTSVNGAGDVNKDGYDDIIIGAPGANSAAGVSYIVYGSNSLPSTINLANLNKQGVYITGGTAKDNSGFSVAGAGDVNNDGYDDIIIGAPGANSAAGISYLIFGGTNPININLFSIKPQQGFSIIGANINDASGTSVSGAGDVNNDGYDDVIIGAPGASSYAGVSYLIYGFYEDYTISTINLATLLVTQGIYINGVSANDISGTSVSSAGDVNNDGYDDVIIGAPGADSTSGASYVVFGSPQIVPTSHTSDPTHSPTQEPWQEKAENWLENNWYVFFSTTAIPLFFAKQICYAIIAKVDENPYNTPQTSNNNNGLFTKASNCISGCFSKPGDYITYLLAKSEWLVRGCKWQFLDSYESDKEKAKKIDSSGRTISVTNGMEMVRDKQEFKLSESIMESGVNIDNPLYNPSSASSYSSQLDDVTSQRHSIVVKANSNTRSCVIMSIDAMMDPEHVRLQDEEFKRFGQNLQQAYQEISQGLSKSFCYAKDTTQKLLKSTDEKSNTLVLPEAQESNNPEFFSSSNNLIFPLLTARQAIEYIPIMKYVSQNIIYPLVESHLPESSKNISLPEILDSRTFLFTAHLGLGSIGAMMMPQETIYKGIIASTASSTAFGVRLAASDYLAEKKQEVLSNDRAMDAFEITKYCVSTILAYTVPAFVACALGQVVMPGYQCTELDLGAKLSFAGVECYSVYKATQAPMKPTTADIVVPYVADGIAAVVAYTNGYGAMAVMCSVVNADWISRALMDMVHKEVKAKYIDPIFEYIQEMEFHEMNNLSQLSNLTLSYFE